jgi:hypothetical protein
MIRADSWGKDLICKTCKTTLAPIGDDPGPYGLTSWNENYAMYPVCPCLPIEGLSRRYWFNPSGKTEQEIDNERRFMSEFYEDLPGPKCECGSAKAGVPFHSDWCPARREP